MGGADPPRFAEVPNLAYPCVSVYVKARHPLGDAIGEQRLDLLMRIMRILFAVIPRERAEEGA